MFEDDRRQLQLEDEVATLVITNVMARDSGEYVVSAGDQASTLELVVQGRRKFSSEHQLLMFVKSNHHQLFQLSKNRFTLYNSKMIHTFRNIFISVCCFSETFSIFSFLDLNCAAK